ncbi:MAG: YceH family protein [Granulosicoccus sp.]
MQDPDNNTNNGSPKPPQLLSIELRVLGALMEKQLNTPDQYPLTVNSIITACNQKTGRDPVTNYHQGEVLRCLRELEEKNFVRKEYGSRSDKYSQQFISQLELGKKQQAVLCIMMLRGPQTISELSTRTQRMELFQDKDDLQHCVDRLCERGLPYAIHLGTPGQRGERIAHLFSGTPVLGASVQRASVADAAPGLSEDDTTALSVLELEVASLTEKIERIERENITLRHQIETLYRLSNHDLPTESGTE